MVNGVWVEGAQNVFFAQLVDPQTIQFSVEAPRFMAGKFPMMIFGLPGAALAMLHCARSDQKKAVGGLLLSAALTSMLTGITEPLEFTFLFVAPLLYAVHCVLAGLAYFLMHWFQVGVGMTFSGGLIDLTLFGILQGNAKTNWIWIVVVGAAYFVLYYLIFSLLIKKMDLKTPGRETEARLYTREDLKNKQTSREPSQAHQIIQGLGGAANILDLDCCATRLRVTVQDPKKVDVSVLKTTQAAGVFAQGKGVQIVYGPKVSVIKSSVEELLADPQSKKEIFLDASKIERLEPIEIKAVTDGKAEAITEAPEQTFSSKMLGGGDRVFPESWGYFCTL